MKAGADINIAQRNGLTPLLIAIRERHTDIVRSLLARGANVHVRDAEGRGPLAFAAAAGLEELTAVLIVAGCEA